MVENDSRLAGQMHKRKHLLFALFFVTILAIANLFVVACSRPSNQSSQYPLQYPLSEQPNMGALREFHAIRKLSSNKNLSWSAGSAKLAFGKKAPILTVHRFNPEPEFALDINAVLRDPQGWMLAGVLFEELPRNTLAADIVFIIATQTEKETEISSLRNNVCGVTCVKFSKNICFVLMPLRTPIDSSRDASPFSSSEQELISNVNHELGHCLGLKHSNSKTDIMYPHAGGVVYPNANEISQIKSLMEKTP